MASVKGFIEVILGTKQGKGLINASSIQAIVEESPDGTCRIKIDYDPNWIPVTHTLSQIKDLIRFVQ